MIWNRKKYQGPQRTSDDENKGSCSLSVNNLSLTIRSEGKDCPALTDVSFEVHPGEIVGLVGESGCGKSITSLALIGLLRPTARVTGGQVLLGERDLLSMTEEERCTYRGSRISMIFQDPMSALNALMTVGKQIEECYRIHHPGASKREAKEKTILMMEKAGLPRAEELYHEYPHELSGGMKQRVMIAMALVNHPDLIIADEPTTALDVTIQAQILELLKELNQEFHSMILLISHDLGVVRSVCDRTMVMYGGRIVEEGETAALLEAPEHPYTKGLLSSVPGEDTKDSLLSCIPGFVEPLEKRNPVGCPFAGRCSLAEEICRNKCPGLVEAEGRKVRCFLCGGDQNGK